MSTGPAPASTGTDTANSAPAKSRPPRAQSHHCDSRRVPPQRRPQRPHRGIRAVLKAVANGLDKNPNLKLEIDGYADSTGDAAHNADLSKRRAGAVKSVLVAQYGVDAARLTSSGFGAEKPVASNDTPYGRAENRRVEFVKK